MFSVEASHHSFELLRENMENHSGISIFHNAAGEKQGEIVFYEYPGPYAEYNTTIKGAYDHAPWKSKVRETITRVNTIVLDDLVRENQISKAIVKIDVEGGEYAVLKGMNQSLQHNDLTIIIEYLFSDEKENTHYKAVSYLQQNGFSSHRINESGETELVEDIDDYMAKKGLTSDNIVFFKVS